ncbi:unnamed protein product [Cuscuta epithymum]|uniref:Pentatricopeptide repeat-containing protein n=1 Tax=Cuscuta epithymum TaxID=186058 RepID=A0AAV0DJ42_9ASTE|nr:unnamed protein product [Cuscuta epithymum]
MYYSSKSQEPVEEMTRIPVYSASRVVRRNFLGILAPSNASMSARFAATLSVKVDEEFQFSSHHSLSNHLSRAAAHHANAIKDGSSVRSLHVRNSILTHYLKSNLLNNAYKLFDEFPHRDVLTWTTVLSSLARSGFCQEAMGIFVRVLKEGTVLPNRFTLFGVLKCCSSVSDGLRKGKSLHGWIVIRGMHLDIALENAILDFYVKYEAFDCAEQFFESMGIKNAASWNIMLARYVTMGDMERCVDFFWRMELKDVSSWNTIVSGLLLHGFERLALDFLYEFSKQQGPGSAFNKLTFSISLKLVPSLISFKLGRQIHGKVIRDGKLHDDSLRTSLIDMYCKCKQMDKVSGFFKI